MNTWSEYVRSLVGDTPQEEVGARIGVSGSTISRWRAGKKPGNPAEVAALAQAYNGEVLEAFVAAGYLTYEQAGIQDPLQHQIDSTRRALDRAHAEVDSLSRQLFDLLELQRERRPPEAEADPVQIRPGGLASDMLATFQSLQPADKQMRLARGWAYEIERALDSWPLPVTHKMTDTATTKLGNLYETLEAGPIHAALEALAEVGKYVLAASKIPTAGEGVASPFGGDYALAADSGEREPFDDEPGDGA